MDLGYMNDTIAQSQSIIKAFRLSKMMIRKADLGFSGCIYRLSVFALAINEMLPEREQDTVSVKSSVYDANMEMIERYTLTEQEKKSPARNEDRYRVHYLYKMIAPAIRHCAYWNISYISQDALERAEERLLKILNRIMRNQ